MKSLVLSEQGIFYRKLFTVYRLWGGSRNAPEGVVDNFLGLRRFQALCADNLIQFLFLLLMDKVLPIPFHTRLDI